MNPDAQHPTELSPLIAIIYGYLHFALKPADCDLAFDQNAPVQTA